MQEVYLRMARLDKETTWIMDSKSGLWFIDCEGILSIILPEAQIACKN